MAGFRVFIEKLQTHVGCVIEIPRAESHHLVRVLRARSGDALTVFDGSGRVAYGKLISDGKSARLAVEEIFDEPIAPYRLEIVSALLKGKSMDMLLRAATECGATHITLLETERVEAKFTEKDIPAKMAGWTEQIIEACKQCGCLRLPELSEPIAFDRWLSLNANADKNVFTFYCSLEMDALLLLEALYSKKNTKTIEEKPCVRMVIGPEGDFTQHEYERLRKSGFQPVKLGKYVLRAGTAATYALSVADQFLRQT